MFVVACERQAQEEGSASATPRSVAQSAKPAAAVDDAADRSPGKPMAPISIQYNVIGKAVVGQPVGINLQVSSDLGGKPVTLHYRVNDPSAVLFPESQARRIEMSAAPDDSPRMQQVTVIPQREGRLFLIVSAEIETENGTMFRSLAIPIQVGAGSTAPAVNGEIRESAEGETVISMPADESGDN